MQQKIIQSPYNYTAAAGWLLSQGKLQFGNSFILEKKDRPVLRALLCYFMQDEIGAPLLNINLKKGILLAGPVGCGKSSLMFLLRRLVPPDRKFQIKSCRQVSFEFMQDGYEVIHRYSRGRHYPNQVSAHCFDDFGAEATLRYYGNECNVMAEIFLSRYELFVEQQIITHLTTNLALQK